MIALNLINFSGNPPLLKLTPFSGRKISFKAEIDDTLSLNKPNEEKLQKDFDKIFELAKYGQAHYCTPDEKYDEYRKKFDRGIEFLKDKFDNGEINGKFVNKNLQYLADHTVKKLRDSEWEEAVNIVLDNVNQKETNAFSVYKKIAHFMQHTNDIVPVYYNDEEQKHKIKVREFFTPNEILEVFKRIIGAIKPENTKDIPEQDTSATDVCVDLAHSLGLIPSQKRKNQFYAVLEIIDPKDKKYYEVLHVLCIACRHHIRRPDKLSAFDALIDHVDQKNPAKWVDTVNDKLKNSLQYGIINSKLFTTEEVKPLKEKLAQKIKEREEFLGKSENNAE